MASSTGSSVIQDLALKGRRPESPINCMLYETFDSDQVNEPAYVAEYCARLKYLIEDFRELLREPLLRFWSKMISDKTILSSIDSYLAQVPRAHRRIILKMPEAVRVLCEELHRSVFFVLLRCGATKCKQETTCLDVALHARLLYEHYIFDVPRLMDFIVLYGIENGKLVSSMISAIFNKQPRYKDDFIRVFLNLDDLLDRVCVLLNLQPKFSQFFQERQKISSDHPLVHNSKKDVAVASSFLPECNAKSLLVKWNDALLYVEDMMLTYEAMLRLSPSSNADPSGTASPLLPLMIMGNVGIKLAAFYELFIPQANLWYQSFTSEISHETVFCKGENMEQLIAHVAYRLVRVANHILRTQHLRDDHGELRLSPEEALEKLLHQWQGLIMAYPLFTCASDAVASIRALFLSMSSSCSHDRGRVSYLLQSVDLVRQDLIAARPPGFFLYEPSIETSSPESASASSSKHMNLGKEAQNHQQAEQNIREIFPHLTTTVVLKHLKEENYDVEKTIARLCDLPPGYEEVQNQLELEVSSEDDTDTDENEITEQERLEAFNLDAEEKRQLLERYQFQEDVTEEDENGGECEALDLELVRELEGLSMEEVERRWETRMLLSSRRKRSLEMEDEYDDTYDSNIPACEKELGASEKVNNNTSSSTRQDEAEPASSTQEFRPGYLDKVQGGPRGRGQTSDTMHSRHLKEKNKSKVANHNRRYLADKKRRGGF